MRSQGQEGQNESLPFKYSILALLRHVTDGLWTAAMASMGEGEGTVEGCEGKAGAKIEGRGIVSQGTK